ncbi:hypothetical protein AG1IA_08398 [Rhizoctonia solani AG-1 IA]|uniref:Uncharacterized protein n=1 Tax=Thanatephorus cucumeris (strain AG1-IA) TaxID=983506 RepID=L8WMJ3_THACA|nr:hypothetical protein AG1IA_08398 [Rhizoctonia solani AG-1 IA]
MSREDCFMPRRLASSYTPSTAARVCVSFLSDSRARLVVGRPRSGSRGRRGRREINALIYLYVRSHFMASSKTFERCPCSTSRIRILNNAIDEMSSEPGNYFEVYAQHDAGPRPPLVTIHATWYALTQRA